ncbi:ANK_REP_REGION domain-containing protein [Durusdinium trenchii]|uniref:ANK_REP_REGION domain-containing protein n=1 Tax=Durusdinium trenchii TaxID=1381693 RepID=A0ABP0Q4T7_9DINO
MNTGESLLEYLQGAYMQDTPLELSEVTNLLKSGVDLSETDDGMPALHYACLNESTDPQQLFLVITSLLMHGADPKVKDSDDDTALEAILGMDDVEEEALQAHVAAARALIHSPDQPVGKDEVASICGWLRQNLPEAVQAQAGWEVLFDPWRVAKTSLSHKFGPQEAAHGLIQEQWTWRGDFQAVA